MKTKRALITVDQEAWEGIQALLPELNIPKSVFSAILNSFLRTQYKLLKGLKQKKDSGEKISMGTFLRMMGDMVSEFEDDQMKL